MEKKFEERTSLNFLDLKKIVVNSVHISVGLRIPTHEMAS